MDPYTLHPGVRLELDEGAGRDDGPRVIDAAAGLVRFQDSSRDMPFSALRAVAATWVEREVRTLGARSTYAVAPRWVHVVALVPRRCPDEVAALLDRLARGEPDPPGFFLHAAAREVDRAAVHVLIASSALGARRAAKAIARLAALPVVELYGERPVYRSADELDLCLRDVLAQEPPRPEPGPAPAGIDVVTSASELALRVSPPARRMGPFVASTALLVAMSIGGLALGAIAFGLVGLASAAALAAYAFLSRGREDAQLVIGKDRIEWERGGRRATMEVGALEMVRIYESTLILVGQDDEVRAELPSPDHAEWARRAIEHRLGAKQTGYR